MLATALLSALASKPVICIDPGHPSEVGRGTSGKQIFELKLAWNIGVGLRKRLVKDGYTVVMTKDAEEAFVSNKKRAEIANQAHAAFMVRLHCDAAEGTGFTVYFPDRQGTNGGFKGPSRKLIKQVRPLAVRFHEGLAESLQSTLKDNGLHSDAKTAVGSKQGALTGSIYSKVPVVLVEMCVLTNPKDEKLMLSSAGQKAMIEGLSAGVRRAVPVTR